MNIKKTIILSKAQAISDAKINFVSLVDKAANKRQFLITKAGILTDGQPDQASFSTLGKILKVDDTTHYVTGIVYEPLVEDADGNFMTEDEIRKAAHWFAKNGDKIDIQHSFEAIDGVAVVENYIAPCDMAIGDTPVIKGTWLMTVEVTNTDVWEKVQKGEVTGFSMGGMGKYSEIETDLDETVEKKSILKQLAGLFGYDLVKKGEVKDKYDKTVRSPNFWSAWYSLEETLRKYNWQTDEYDFISDEEAIKEALTEFSDIIQNLLLTPNIAKTLKEDYTNKNETEESEVTKTEMQTLIDGIHNILDETIKKNLEVITADKAGTPAPDNGPIEPITAEVIKAMIDEAVKKSAEPENKPLTLESIQEMITAAIEPVLKSRGLPNNLNGDGIIEKNEETHYLTGII